MCENIRAFLFWLLSGLLLCVTSILPSTRNKQHLHAEYNGVGGGVCVGGDVNQHREYDAYCIEYHSVKTGADATLMTYVWTGE